MSAQTGRAARASPECPSNGLLGAGCPGTHAHLPSRHHVENYRKVGQHHHPGGGICGRDCSTVSPHVLSVPFTHPTACAPVQAFHTPFSPRPI